jgi:glycosyltransferase involved in cell wall biosynthesis
VTSERSGQHGSLKGGSTLPASRPVPLDNVVFAHDVWLYRHADGRVLSARGPWLWDRYRSFADSVTVACRMRETESDASIEGFHDVSRPGVEFVAVPSLSGPVAALAHRREATAILTSLLRRSDGLVARLPSEIGTLAVRLAHRLGTPYAVEVVTCTWDALWHRGGVQGKLYAPISRAATRAIVRDAPYALYVTRDFLQERYPTRGHSVACSNVELDELDESVLERRLEAIREARRPLVVGTIAVLTVRFKGVQTALQALGSIRERLPQFEFQIVGTGDPEPWRRLAVRHGVADVVSFEGVLSSERVLDWLDRVDLYVQPSFQEGLPRSLIEAMSRACPALGSTAGGIPELLQPACLHEPGDARALAELILHASESSWQEAQARHNFETAKSYTRGVLDPIRARFWDEFAVFARRS